MKLLQLSCAIFGRHITNVLGFGVLAVSAQPLAAQDQVSVPSKWEVGVTPTVQLISRELAGHHVWGGGLTASATYRHSNVFAVNAAVLGAFAPQLNYRNSSPLNSLVGTLSGELHRRSVHSWDPYLAVGGGFAKFHYENPPVGLDKDKSYAMAHAAIGVRFALTQRLYWRAEAGRQISQWGASPTYMAGLSFRLHDKVSK